jgi:hypothetical protein
VVEDRFHPVSSTAPAASVPFAIFVVIILLVLLRVVRRTFANYRGTVFSLARTIVFGAIYVFIGVVFSVFSFVEGVPYLLAVPQLLLVAAAAYWSYRYTDKRISFWRPTEGTLYFRGGIVIYLIYIVGMLTRLSIDLVFIGPSMFDLASSVQLSGTALYESIATDLLLIFGVGLLIGRNVRVARRYLRIRRGEEVVPTEAPMSGMAPRLRA